MIGLGVGAEDITSEMVIGALAAVVAIFSAAGAAFSYLGKREATAANDAVNHVHKTGTGRLYDIVLMIQETVLGHEQRFAAIDGKLDESQEKLEDHAAILRAHVERANERGEDLVGRVSRLEAHTMERE